MREGDIEREVGEKGKTRKEERKDVREWREGGKEK